MNWWTLNCSTLAFLYSGVPCPSMMMADLDLSMGLGAGGTMRQEIFKDTGGLL
jgi:hypothetical protein